MKILCSASILAKALLSGVSVWKTPLVDATITSMEMQTPDGKSPRVLCEVESVGKVFLSSSLLLKKLMPLPAIVSKNDNGELVINEENLAKATFTTQHDKDGWVTDISVSFNAIEETDYNAKTPTELKQLLKDANVAFAANANKAALVTLCEDNL